MSARRRRNFHTVAAWIGGAGAALSVWIWCMAQLDVERQLIALVALSVAASVVTLIILARHHRR